MSAQSRNNGVRLRQGKYKYATPPWKEVYRKRCLRRLQEGRSKLVDKFRRIDEDQSENSNLVQEVMEEEWDALRQEKNNCLSSDSLQYNPFASAAESEPNEDLNDIINIVEEIQNELIKEEQLMLSKYEEGLKFEEERLCAAIQCLQTDDLICPICKQNPLLQNRQIIFCSCGIRIDTESDAITLEFVRNQLRDAMEQHSNEGCLAEALFSVSSYPELGVSNLIMACKSCDFLAVIL